MIYTEKADDRAEAARLVTTALLKEHVPERPVVLKPNVVEPLVPPVTTHVKVVEGVVIALREAGVRDIVIAEGSGTGDTLENFHALGYQHLGVELVDLDREETVTLSAEGHRQWEEVIVPEMLVHAFLISIPVLKEHSICGVSISLKNMIGILPEKYYSGYWSYKKSLIHKDDPHGCIADVCTVMKPSLAVVDASVGMRGSHLSGTPIDPPLNVVYGSSDLLEADIYGCGLLSRNWKDIAYLRMLAEDAEKIPGGLETA